MRRPILIVEDEENDVFFLRRALEKTGIGDPILAVADGQEALDYLSGSGKFADRTAFPFPCFMFLDLKLPQVHGLDVLRWMRSSPSMQSVIVIVLTSSTLHSDIENAYQAGANSYVVKPPNPERLINMAQSFASWWLTFCHPTPGCH